MNERSIFAAALDIADAAERVAYLDRACGNDAALRRQVDRLLVAQGELGSFLDQPPPGIDNAITEAPITEKPGAEIGPYKLLEQIGEGGMGLVFHADQLRPVRRRVALKIIKPGMDSKQVIARFEAERQALALMDHPNIARVLDAGATESGRPYFVMELVRGIPITEYCDQHKLTIRQRLELFMRVCHAVQHAHQKGIIHRDLKPTNVLVAHDDTVPVPKVIDFGVAKATGQSLTERSLFTGIAQMLGTPRYMSPEQAALNLLDVDTRSDIYSLGVLLYELLTGTTPFEEARMKTLGLDEVRRIIQEEEPANPSTRISTLGAAVTTTAERRGVDSRRMSMTLRGDLDWIVMKALDKDRNRRYETANSFALDIGRYLANEPVEACPPSVGYRVRKFARRNKGALATAALFAVMLLLAVGAVAGIAGAWINDRAAQEAEKRRDREEREVKKERERLAAEQAVEADLREAELLHEQERWPEMSQVLERARSRLVITGSTPLRERVEQRRKDLEPKNADFHLNLGVIFRFKGDYKAALASMKTAHELASKRPEFSRKIAVLMKVVEQQWRVSDQLKTLAKVGEPEEIKELLTKDDSSLKSKFFKTYSRQFKAGKHYLIDLLSDGCATYLIAKNAAGKVLAEDIDGGQGMAYRLLFVPPADGEYTIIIVANEAGATGSFTLRFQEYQPADHEKRPND